MTVETKNGWIFAVQELEKGNIPVSADAGSGLAAAANLQALAVALSARIKALEDAPPAA